MTDKTNNRMYNIVWINKKTGATGSCTSYPMPHKESCTMLSKMTKHPDVDIMLEEFKPRL